MECDTDARSRNARAIREGMGMSLEDVMRKSSFSAGHLARFERGEGGLSIPKLQELAQLYGCTIDELLAEVPTETATNAA